MQRTAPSKDSARPNVKCEKLGDRPRFPGLPKARTIKKKKKKVKLKFIKTKKYLFFKGYIKKIKKQAKEGRGNTHSTHLRKDPESTKVLMTQ